ncbi:MAG: hypothetical protein LAO03_03175 [Acidobacteriia bacterium]|nr:hypothetical protein [Terriglobia bacterium]
MDRGEIIFAVLTSAAVGALVSSVITVIAQWRERKSRREELVLSKATEMATNRVATLMKTSGKIEPDILMAEDYYVSLKHLIDKGYLDKKTKERLAAELARHGLEL